MAAHENIHEYYLHQHRNIENYLELCLIHPEVELVHELRLSIKKLRAFHKLAVYLFLDDAGEQIHIRHRVQRLYKTAGQLRDIQVQIMLLTAFQEQTGIEYPEFSKWLNKREKKMLLRFSKKPGQVSPKAITQGTQQKIDALLAVADDAAIINGTVKVLTAMYSEVQDLTAITLNNRNLHHIRTVTKQMRYILNIIHHSFPDFKFDKISIETLREIEVAAGNWHDKLVRIESIEKCINKMKFTDESEKFKYQKLYNACKAELDISFSETSLLVRKALLPESQD